MKDKRSRQRYSLSLSLVLLALAGWLCLPDRAPVSLRQTASAAATFTVTDAGDGGCPTLIRNCTLRQVIIAANNNPGVDTINFNITTGPGLVKTISPLSELPAITDPVIIDGTSQPGYAGQPLIVLNGANAGTTSSGLTITAGGSAVKGLAINRFAYDGIYLHMNGGNIIQGNYLGTDAAGNTDLGNGLNGVRVLSNNNLIGGTTPAARNVISGNNLAGILTSASGNQIQRNYIGTNAAGTSALGNLTGILMQGGGVETVGGASPGFGNVISGNTGIGIVTGAGSSARVQGNFIGTDWSGNSSIPNTAGGIHIGSSSGGCIVGGTSNGERNVISGNGSFGVSIDAGHNQLFSNFIGMSANAGPLGNSSSGVVIANASDNSIQGNTVAFNGSDGITVSSGTGNLILSNRTYSNGGLGIDLGPNGVTPNDPGDGDTGGNDLQNYPVLSSAVLVSNTVTIRGTLNSTPNTFFSIQIFGNEECDPSGFGEGKSPYAFVSGLATDANGNLSFIFEGEPRLPGTVFSAAATKLVAGVGNETSEFSPCRQMVAPGKLQLSSDSYNVNENRTSASVTINRVGGSDGVASASLSTSNGTATAGQDYTNATGVITLVSGETSKTILVPITDDNLVEGSETINLSLSSVTGGVPIGMPSSAVLTIDDNDDAPSNLQFSTTNYSIAEGAGFATITVTRTVDTSGTVTVDYATSDIGAQQRTDYTITAGTITFAPGEASKTFPVLIVDDVYVEGNEVLNLSLSNPTGGGQLISPSVATLTITDNDFTSPTTNPDDQARFFAQQHFYDFLSRYPDSTGWDFWTGQITQCGSDPLCIRNKRIDVSNAFFYELEYQQTGAYVFRLYRAAFGNNQPFPNPDSSNLTEAKKLPGYAVFASDRARVVGGSSLAAGQQNIADAFVLRSQFLARYPASQDGPTFVDALLNNISDDTGVDLNSQRTALINLFSAGGRSAVLYRLADDNATGNPINNRAFIDAEYNRAFVATQYFGYLRRDADIGGLLFWLGQVNSAPLRDTTRQHAMVCAFITSTEYQQRFSAVVTHTNSECSP